MDYSNLGKSIYICNASYNSSFKSCHSLCLCLYPHPPSKLPLAPPPCSYSIHLLVPSWLQGTLPNHVCCCELDVQLTASILVELKAHFQTICFCHSMSQLSASLLADSIVHWILRRGQAQLSLDMCKSPSRLQKGWQVRSHWESLYSPSILPASAQTKALSCRRPPSSPCTVAQRSRALSLRFSKTQIQWGNIIVL